jgi:hypothetical protein
VRRIILDTDVASLVIKQRLPATLTRQLLAAESGITFVTYGELTRWSIMRQWAPLAGAAFVLGEVAAGAHPVRRRQDPAHPPTGSSRRLPDRSARSRASAR